MLHHTHLLKCDPDLAVSVLADPTQYPAFLDFMLSAKVLSMRLDGDTTVNEVDARIAYKNMFTDSVRMRHETEPLQRCAQFAFKVGSDLSLSATCLVSCEPAELLISCDARFGNPFLAMIGKPKVKKGLVSIANALDRYCLKQAAA